MATLVCQNCGREVETTLFKLRSGQKYCSRECKAASTKTRLTPGRVETTCHVCGKKYIVPVAWIREGRRKYCSQECRFRYQQTVTGERAARWGKGHTSETRDKISRTRTERGVSPKGENHPNWKGGRLVQDGYVSVHIPTLPEPEAMMARQMRPKEAYILEHRLSMAMKIGRPLKPTELVHHINGDKMDNRPENLAIAERSKHSQEHRLIEKELATLREMNRRLTFLLLMCLRSGSNTSS